MTPVTTSPPSTPPASNPPATTLTTPEEEISRPLYIRRVPESTWNRVHENAIRSRMRLSAYLVKLMEQSQPFPPMPLPNRERNSTPGTPEVGD